MGLLSCILLTVVEGLCTTLEITQSGLSGRLAAGAGQRQRSTQPNGNLGGELN